MILIYFMIDTRSYSVSSESLYSIAKVYWGDSLLQLVICVSLRKMTRDIIDDHTSWVTRSMTNPATSP